MTEETLSWRAITAHCPVIASDGVDIGRVTDVAALEDEDIFHGVVFRHHALARMILAPAADIGLISATAVNLTTDSIAAAAYEDFHPLVIERLGLKGAFRWKHLGWKQSDH